MNNSYDLNSILNAIEDINNKTKRKIILPELSTLKKINSSNEEVLPATEKLILEAEKYSNKFKNESLIEPTLPEDILILDNEYKERDFGITNLEEIKNNIIDDLYSSLSKKVKKNTLKTIVDLRHKINYLEEEIKIINRTKINNINEQDDNNLKQNEEHLINEDFVEEEKKYTIDEKNNDLPNSVIKTLKIQDTLIKEFEKNEEKFRLKIVDLMQDISLLNNKKINPTKNIPEIPSYKLKTISDDQIQELNQRNSKNESEIIFFKENYAKLIIENNELKIKLLNSKERIVIFEKNIIELEKGFENLSKILSKNSIIKLSDALLKNPLDDAKSKKDY
tara:strand:- start:502 stop:1509 length:1008 start_codon:yes stop_codon:yes gene_type:complete